MAPRLTCRATCACLTALLFSSCAPPPQVSDGGTLKVTVNGQPFDAELRLSRESRAKGLGGRDDLPEGRAMLFAYPDEAVRNFVMRDCRFPVAVIFLDGKGRVVKTHAMPVEKPGTAENDLIRYSSESSMQFALEVKAEQLEKLGVKAGETVVVLPFEALAQAAE